ncbi:thiolase family protein [Actinomycetospora endophytica]|uniref:propanoyl-CoA C-acyltransferase n=1 Tax=Actinomycetospora endophytica TaxID=2291215 RepID=A0ABS8PAQ5_9PSEU|nr:thiolase family protein [Actinomycetospora endophytica]MCD2195342.1 thiolase family protein [Actinomycetospora endophytica]
MSTVVRGVGTSAFGKQSHRGAPALLRDAVTEALDDAGTPTTGIDAVFAGTVFDGPGTIQRCLQTLGIVGVPVVTVENACASGTTAFHEAVEAVRLGRYENVLAVGVETMTHTFSSSIVPEDTDREGRSGMAMPSIYGMAAARYAAEFGTTPEQLAAVAVKNFGNGVHNPRAARRRGVSVEEVLASRMIADPLTVLQCCGMSDAAAAAVVGPARNAPDDVTVRATALRSGGLWDHRSTKVWGWDVVHDTAAAAFETAGVGASDVDVFEVHDAFTIGEVVTTEALGLAPLGEGGRLAAAGVTTLSGRSPVNPSGGLLSRGHPLGATGLAQVAEIVWQLRGLTGARQVDGARLGVVETMGGGAAGIDGNGCVVAVLEGAA